MSPNICFYVSKYSGWNSWLRSSALGLRYSGCYIDPLPPPRIASICNSETTSVRSGVSIPISDRRTGRAQVESPTCRKWRMTDAPHRSGRSCLIPIAAPAGNPAVRLWSLSLIRSGVSGKSCGSQRGLFLSITFNICLGVAFNLFYSTTPLDNADLPQPLESNEMAVLMSVSMLTGDTNNPTEMFSQAVFWSPRNCSSTLLESTEALFLQVDVCGSSVRIGSD